jgi:hypothetical protein
MFGMDSVKLTLAVSCVLLVFCIGFYFYQSHDLEQLKKDVGYCFAVTLPDVGKISSEASVKKEEIKNDRRRDLQFHRYVAERAHESNISEQDLKTGRPREYPNTREGYVDIKTEITPAGKGPRQQVHRRNIASFIFSLENRTNSLKVTSLTLSKPSEDHERWAMRLEVTERKPLK